MLLHQISALVDRFFNFKDKVSTLYARCRWVFREWNINDPQVHRCGRQYTLAAKSHFAIHNPKVFHQSAHEIVHVCMMSFLNVNTAKG